MRLAKSQDADCVCREPYWACTMLATSQDSDSVCREPYKECLMLRTSQITQNKRQTTYVVPVTVLTGSPVLSLSHMSMSSRLAFLAPGGAGSVSTSVSAIGLNPLLYM